MIKRQSLIVISVYAVGVLVFLLIAHTPFYLPCIWKAITNIPCPTCGLTRAFLYLYQLNIISAVKMSILSAPLIIGVVVHLICAFADLIWKTSLLNRFNMFFAKSWVLVTLLILIFVSWGYNIYMEFYFTIL